MEARLGPVLHEIGARYIEDRVIDMGGGYSKDIVFYRVGDRLIELESSYPDGINCRFAPPGVGETSDFVEWQTLWQVFGDRPADAGDDAMFAWIRGHLRNYFGPTP